ncbi:28S rRNA (uridine-N(3))-methyltransferase-like [Clavelina lepadiformis]|uniref:28S rRNA (uridine-N(3))-methyltransferase-like n=1 Tax=Clavelina lepadiformis TaxID=159417 RepID=UPI0040432A7D
MVKHKKDELKLKRKADRKLHKEEKKIRKIEKEYAKKKKSSEQNKKTEVVNEVKNGNSTGRDYTVSVAIPGSILDNAQSPELRTYLAGQIGRACVVFQIDEIVVYDESASATESNSTEGDFAGVGKKGQCNVQLARILQYLECPQYLRKVFFPKHHDLQYAGILNPLDCPHHMRVDDFMPYREGVVVDRPVKPGKGSFANCGTHKLVQIDKVLQPNIRVTVKMQAEGEKQKKYLKGCVVPPEAPRTDKGIYWGYAVRLANCLSSAIVDCPYKDTGKYDLTVGTSERGDGIDDSELPKFKHCLIVFGGVKGLESALESDDALSGIDDPRLLFDKYFNTCPIQGSRTIRTEEAILISMSALRPKIGACFSSK